MASGIDLFVSTTTTTTTTTTTKLRRNFDVAVVEVEVTVQHGGLEDVATACTASAITQQPSVDELTDIC